MSKEYQASLQKLILKSNCPFPPKRAVLEINIFQTILKWLSRSLELRLKELLLVFSHGYTEQNGFITVQARKCFEVYFIYRNIINHVC